MTGAKDLKGLTAGFRLDGFVYLLQGFKYWKAEAGAGASLTIAKDGEYPKDLFVDFFGCPVKVLGACVGGRCSSGSDATSAMASLATTDHSWKKYFLRSSKTC